MRRTGVVCMGVLAAALAADNEAASRWWAHVQYLADDAREGRKPGTKGYDEAARYVASQFDALKLRPGGSNGWFQPVPFVRRQIDESASKVQLLRDGRTETLDFERHTNIGLRSGVSGTTEAEMVFVGHGLVVPEAGVDDLKGLDLKGRIAVVLGGAPKGLPAALAAHAQSTRELWSGLRSAGAVGVVRLYNTNTADIPWERATLSRAEPVLVLTPPELSETPGQRVSVSIGPEGADKLLAGTGHTFASLLAKDKAGEPLPKFQLPGTIRVVSSFSTATVSSDNVIGVLPGSDPKLAREFVVFTAHLDHMGVGKPIRGDSIYNGAMDNASGVATLIETARAMQGRKLRRSVAFVAVTGEESGLTGSKFFAHRPTIGGAIVANVNIDMFLPIVPLKAITVRGLDESDLGDDFAAVSRTFGIPAKRDPEPQRNSFTRSDQYSFIRRGIPALSFSFYAEPGTAEGDVLRKWRTERYHAPSDDLDQPVNLEGAAKFNSIMAAFLERVANRDARPAWKETSFFRRFAK
jgi:hypothetical protein